MHKLFFDSLFMVSVELRRRDKFQFQYQYHDF